MELTEYSKAEDYFTKIKNDYSSSAEATDINIYIQRAQIAKN